MAMMQLADHLGKLLWEVGEAPAAELPCWLAYFKLKGREEERAAREAKRDARRKGRGPGRRRR